MRPGLLTGVIYAVWALLPVGSLTAIARHLDRRGVWLLLPWGVLMIVVLLGEGLRHFFAIGFTPNLVGTFYSTVLLGEVRAGAAAAVLITSVALAISGRKKA